MAERKTNAPFLILPLLAFAAGLILLNGVLDLRIPKPERAKPQRVTVTAGAREPEAIEAGEGTVRQGERTPAQTAG